MRLASFNVENLFARPKAMAPEQGDGRERAAALTAHAELSQLLDRVSYEGVENRILELLGVLGVLSSDTGGKYAQLRKVRGKIVTRRTSGTVELAARGRGDWVG